MQQTVSNDRLVLQAELLLQRIKRREQGAKDELAKTKRNQASKFTALMTRAKRLEVIKYKVCRRLMRREDLVNGRQD